ncbi:MAG: radical SAM family heme chaperone HemW [Candidatus Omnitrophica bacterium]|nr:radical SAM family heme chaperone HemW [Candidatus Omnitrophota bacterium]
MANSLYIHIPFCRQKCPYCDFYSINYDNELANSYLKALIQQIDTVNNNFTTLYIGGGTPSVLSFNLLKILLKSLSKLSKKAKEFTIEANPESLDEDKIKLFLDNGVTRLSLGVQSLSDMKLKKLGRIHFADKGRKSILLAKKEGFKNISTDLIFGLPEESLESWAKELKEVVRLPLNHISVYSLTYEKNTLFFKELQKKKIKPLNDEIAAKMYKLAMAYLPKKGFRQYEVSNFAKRGFICRHNYNYWQNKPYLGLGSSAVSFLQGQRLRNPKPIEDYIVKVNKGLNPALFIEKLSPLRHAKETAALKIRTKEGIDFAWFKKECGYDFLTIEAKVLTKLIRERLLKYKKSSVGKRTGIFLTEKGFLFADTVASYFLL